MSPAHPCVTGELVACPLLFSVSQGCWWHVPSSSLCHRGAGGTSLCCLRILCQNPERRHVFPCEGLGDVCGYRQELLTLL